MSAFAIAGIIFVLLSFSALFTMKFHAKLPSRHRDDATNTVVRLVANIFVVMTSLVFGLMINSAKNTYESIDNNMHAYATDLIVLDRTLKNYGPKANDAQQHLVLYMREAIRNPARADDELKQKPDTPGKKLDALGRVIASIVPEDRYQEALLLDIRQQYHRIIQQRWAIIEQSEGSLPMLIIVMLSAWLVLIFASYGYRAPTNAVTIPTFLVSAFLISASIYLVLDMNQPFSGPIQISDAPYRRALAEMIIDNTVKP